MVQALTAPLIHDLNALFRRRSEAISAIVAYCQMEEPVVTKVLEQRQPAPVHELQLLQPPSERREQLRKSVIIGKPCQRKVDKMFYLCRQCTDLTPERPELATTLPSFFRYLYGSPACEV